MYPTKLLMPTQPFLTLQSRIHSHTSLTKLLPSLGLRNGPVYKRPQVQSRLDPYPKEQTSVFWGQHCISWLANPCSYVCTVKLRYDGVLGTGLKGPLYPKSVITKIGYGWLTRVGNIYSAASLATRQLIQPPSLTPALTVCLRFLLT